MGGVSASRQATGRRREGGGKGGMSGMGGVRCRKPLAQRMEHVTYKKANRVPLGWAPRAFDGYDFAFGLAGSGGDGGGSAEGIFMC